MKSRLKKGAAAQADVAVGSGASILRLSDQARRLMTTSRKLKSFTGARKLKPIMPVAHRPAEPFASIS